MEQVCCSMSSSNCCFLTCIQVARETGQVVWYSHLFQNFSQFIVIHTVKGFGIVNKAEIDVFFSGTLLTETLPQERPDQVGQESVSPPSELGGLWGLVTAPPAAWHPRILGGSAQHTVLKPVTRIFCLKSALGMCPPVPGPAPPPTLGIRAFSISHHGCLETH